MAAGPVVLEVPDLATHRLRLRPWATADASALSAAWHDARIAAGSVPPPDRSVDAAKRWIAGWDTRRRAGLALDLVIADPLDDTVMGEIGFSSFDAERSAAMIGWWLQEDRRGRGLAREAVSLVIEWVLATGEITAVLAEIAPDNPASEAVARAVGFEPFAPGVWRRST